MVTIVRHIEFYMCISTIHNYSKMGSLWWYREGSRQGLKEIFDFVEISLVNTSWSVHYDADVQSFVTCCNENDIDQLRKDREYSSVKELTFQIRHKQD